MKHKIKILELKKEPNLSITEPHREHNRHIYQFIINTELYNIASLPTQTPILRVL